MKWLLITTDWNNPGDVFIKRGIENIIRDIDSDAQFVVVNKQEPSEYEKAFDSSIDKIIWCGMPLFWSFPTHYCSDIGWWRQLLRPLMMKRKSDFAVLAAGTVGRISDKVVEAFTRPYEVQDAVHEIADNAALFTMRDDCLSYYFEEFKELTVLPCPAAFAAERVEAVEHSLSCNFMQFGSHNVELEPETGNSWYQNLETLNKIFLELGDFMIPHDKYEAELASNFGWPKDRISSSADILSHIKGSKVYVGNRLHGSVVAAGNGAKSIAIGYDLRLRMAELCGAEIIHIGKNDYFFSKVEKPNFSEVRKKYQELIAKFSGINQCPEPDTSHSHTPSQARPEPLE